MCEPQHYNRLVKPHYETAKTDNFTGQLIYQLAAVLLWNEVHEDHNVDMPRKGWPESKITEDLYDPTNSAIAPRTTTIALMVADSILIWTSKVQMPSMFE